MAVASPRLFLALRLSFPLRLCVSPCLSPRVFTHRSHRTLRPSSCTESVPHTVYAHVYTPTHTHTLIHTCTYTLTHTRIHVRSASRVFARSVYHPSILASRPPPPPPLRRPVPSSLLFVPLTSSELPHTCVPI